MLKKFKSKIITTMVIVLAVIMFVSVPASAIEWSGSTGGGGAGHNTSSSKGDYSIGWKTDNAVGYRFTRVDYDGNRKSGPIDVLASSFASGFIKAQSAEWMSSKFTKIELIGLMYGGSFSTTAFTNAGAIADYDVFGYAAGSSTGPMPSNPKEIEKFVRQDAYLNALCRKFGLGSQADLGNGEKILVEPLFYAKLDGTWCVMTISEIGVWGGWKFGWDQPTTTVDDADYYGYIAYYLNKYWAGLLYNGETNKWWYAGYDAASVKGAYNDNNSMVVSFRHLVDAGFGIAYAFNNTTSPTQPVDLYCWGVEWYSDSNYTNKVAESSINTNNAGENLIEGHTYYPKFWFGNRSGYEVNAWFSVWSYNNAPAGVWEKLCEPMTIGAYGWYGYCGQAVKITNATLYSQSTDGSRWDDYYFNGENNHNLIKYWLEIQPNDSRYYESNSGDNTLTTISGFAPWQALIGAGLYDGDFWGDSYI